MRRRAAAGRMGCGGPGAVHDVVLLAAAETGVWGGAAAAALGGALGWAVWRRRWLAGPAEMVWGLAVAGMVGIALLDHYWWALPPARAVFVTAAGPWARAARPRLSGGGGQAVPAEVMLDARGEALGRLEPHPDVVGVDGRI